MLVYTASTIEIFHSTCNLYKLIDNNLFQSRLHAAWIITNNLLYKIDHHSKNHTSSLDQKSVMAKKTLDQVQSVWLRLYWPRIPDPWGIIAPHYSSSSAITKPDCPNFVSFFFQPVWSMSALDVFLLCVRLKLLHSPNQNHNFDRGMKCHCWYVNFPGDPSVIVHFRKFAYKLDNKQTSSLLSLSYLWYKRQTWCLFMLLTNKFL